MSDRGLMLGIVLPSRELERYRGETTSDLWFLLLFYYHQGNLFQETCC